MQVIKEVNLIVNCELTLIDVAEWCYEAIAERLEGSLRSARNPIVIHQRQIQD